MYNYDISILGGDLHYICRRKINGAEHLAKVVVSAKEANKLVEFHCSHIGGHFGREKTHEAIIKRLYGLAWSRTSASG